MISPVLIGPTNVCVQSWRAMTPATGIPAGEISTATSGKSNGVRSPVISATTRAGPAGRFHGTNSRRLVGVNSISGTLVSPIQLVTGPSHGLKGGVPLIVESDKTDPVKIGA